MISKGEKDQIRHIISSPQWRTVEKVAEDYIKDLKDQSNMRNTQWETLQATLLEEGQIMGIRNFIQTLYKDAS